MPQWFPIVASVVLAALPVVIWLKVVSSEDKEKSLYIKTFLAGTLAVIPPFVLIFAFDKFPDLNIYSLINRSIEQVALAAILTNIVVGVIEEIAKNVIVRVIDKRHPEYIQTIGAALRLSICAGLGFSFAENIFYFYNIWISPQFGAQDIFATFVFRSMFTMCGHMVFSGIFGYYFGIGKFAADITEASRWEGRGQMFARFISRITGKMTFQVVREMKNLKGLFLAMALHASFNVSLDLQHKLPSILIVVISVIYIYYLMKTKSGHLLFSITKRKASNMASKDEDVVLELLGMWTRDGKYAEVIQICDRLLVRDPDNNVVKLFRAKASDNQKIKSLYTSLKGILGKNKIETKKQSTTNTAQMSAEEEKVVLEVMETWYKEKKYSEVLNVAKKLLARNPNSEGAKLLLGKAMDKTKLDRIFDSLTMLFE
jgi:RsiW-degrading membrane proteinase PrsW (M82 family)